MDLEQAMTKIKAADRARLEFNFEQTESDYVKVGDDLYVGVFLERIEHLEVIEKQGNWATAKRRKHEDV